MIRIFRLHLLFVLLVATMCIAALRAAVAQEEKANLQQEKNPPPAFTSSQIEFFKKEVLPILKTHCWKCHGQEEKVRGGLRLTSRAAVLKGGDLGPAVSLAKPQESVILEAINYESLEMPPTGKLPQAKIDILTKWVKMKLPWSAGTDAAEEVKKEHSNIEKNGRDYWAYQPRRVAPPPPIKMKGWVHNRIDAYLLAKMEQHGLTPAPPADPVALIRRAYYDLTGLPPSPQDVDRFLANPSLDAYEKLLDRLLDSPQYGEKWGRHWLDLVRYAETHGYERDSPKPFAWRYRDYVIQSFNEDKPYDVFLREQLAGDELEKVTRQTITATGFYRLGIWDDEPADRLLAQYDMLDDIVKTTGEVVLGMTLGCARCHDHKGDPIPQRDYYRMVAFFRDVTYMDKENLRQIANDEAKREHAQKLVEKTRREGELYQQIYRLGQQFRLALAKTGAEVLPISDISGLTYRFYRDTWESLPDFASLKAENAGRIADNYISLQPASRREAIGLVFEGDLKVPQEGEYTFFVDSTEGVRLVIDDRQVIDRPQGGRHQLDKSIKLKSGPNPFRLEYFNRYARPRIQLSWMGPGVERRNLSSAGLRPRREKVKLEALLRQHRKTLGADVDRYFQLQSQLAKSRKQKLPPPGVQVMAVTESGRADTHVLIRGNPRLTGEKVEPGIPSVLGDWKGPVKPPRPGDASSGKRLALSDWLTDEGNPLTARVLANRLWHFHFGRGIVPTPSDFGQFGEKPTHTALLDWLAAELIRVGWRLKPMHKRIMMSSAYRMSSRIDENSMKTDPDNQWLWRFGPRRLTAEEVRDSILSVSGRLNLKRGGPSIYPTISREVLAGQSRPGSGWGKSSPQDQSRRSVYVHVKRSLLLPVLENHDAADTDSSCAMRHTTIVPTQSLAMLNGEFTNQQAAVFAQRLRKERPSDLAGQIRRAIRLTTSRTPEQSEVDKDVKFIMQLQGAGLKEKRALTYYCLLMLNTNEFVFLD